MWYVMAMIRCQDKICKKCNGTISIKTILNKNCVTFRCLCEMVVVYTDGYFNTIPLEEYLEFKKQKRNVFET